MSTSVILNITELAEDQANKYTTINNMLRDLERATNRKLTASVTGSGPYNLTLTECTKYAYYVASGASGNFNFVFLGEPDLTNNANRLFFFKNATSYIATVKSDAAGTTVAVNAGASVVIHQDHDDMVKIAEFDGLTTAPYDIGFSYPGVPSASIEVLKFVAVRAIDFADDFADSKGHVGTNPTATAAFDVKKNGSTIGSISVSTSGVFTFSTTGGATALAVGDRITIQAPSPADATMADIGVVLKGTRTL